MNYNDFTNEQLLERYQNLDEKAFDEFFRRNSSLIFAFIASRLGVRSEAEEIVQETFFRIHKYILRYDPSQNAMSWTFTIAKNCLIDHVAKRKKQFAVTEQLRTHASHNEEDPDFQENARTYLEKSLKNLSNAERQLIEQRFLAEKTYDEIAELEGITAAGVRQRLSRILRKLRNV